MPAQGALWRNTVERDGFIVLPDVFTGGRVHALLDALTPALDNPTGESALRGREGIVYAARNVLSLWPAAATVWRQPPLPAILAVILGPRFGLVRVLFFDKPPDRSWSLPWHKDMTIAVKDNHLPSRQFNHPTRKAGVPHVEAPQALLEAMLTVRIHLDDITDENGPLHVIPGSHLTGKVLQLGETPPLSILVQAGDVLLMRPLLAHSSSASRPETRRHRRIVHLEFAGWPQLPDGYEWHTFLPGETTTS